MRRAGGGLVRRGGRGASSSSRGIGLPLGRVDFNSGGTGIVGTMISSRMSTSNVGGLRGGGLVDRAGGGLLGVTGIGGACTRAFGSGGGGSFDFAFAFNFVPASSSHSS